MHFYFAVLYVKIPSFIRAGRPLLFTFIRLMWPRSVYIVLYIAVFYVNMVTQSRFGLSCLFIILLN